MEYPLSQLKRYHALSDAFIHDLGARIRRLEPARNNTLLLPGDICRDLYLIEKGMLACFDVENDKRYCTWLMTAGDFVTAVDSFNNQVVSTETIVALTDCLLWAITRQDLDELTAAYPEFGVIRQMLTDKYHIQSRIMANYPAMVAGAPVTALASLMGITRTTLYEIIRQRRKKK
jgi:CRP-like cAMP-binding protein